MSDLGKNDQKKPKSAQTGSEASSSPNPTGSPVDQLKSAAKSAESDAAETKGGVMQEAKEVASDVADKARMSASEAVERVRGAAEEQKAAGAERVKGIAGAISRAANELDSEIPQAANYVKRAAAELENLSEAMRQRDVGELVGAMQDFARRQPTVFLGATALLGFAAVRFLSTSAQQRSSQPDAGTPRLQAPEETLPTSGAGGPGLPASAGGVTAAGSTSTNTPGAMPRTGASDASTSSGDPGGISPEAPGLKPTSSGSSKT